MHIVLYHRANLFILQPASSRQRTADPTLRGGPLGQRGLEVTCPRLDSNGPWEATGSAVSLFVQRAMWVPGGVVPGLKKRPYPPNP